MAEDTVFARIARGEIPSDEVYADEEFYAFRDINPAAPVHILVIPRKPIAAITEASEADTELLGKLLLVATKVAVQEGLGEEGFRYVLNCGKDGGQEVMHLHLHVLGGRRLSWPPG